MHLSGGFRRFALAIAGLLTVLMVLAITAVEKPAQSHLLSNLAQSAVVSWAAVACFVTSRRCSPYFRQLWRLLGLALSLAAAGQILVTYYGSILQRPRSMPWPSDILLFIWVAPTAMMLLPWRADDDDSARWERNLDFAQIAIVFVTAYLYFFFVPSLWEADGILMFHRLLDAAVARDVLLATAFLLRGATKRFAPARSLFVRVAVFFGLLGLLEGAVISRLSETALISNWIDASWSIPFVYLVVLAVFWKTDAEPEPAPQSSEQTVWVASQLLPVTIPLLVIFMGRQIAREQITISALAVAGSFACSASRLLITSNKQRRIAEDLRRAELAARQSEQMFSGAFRSSPDAISIAEIPGSAILEINDSYMALTGYSREEVLGNTPEGLGLWVDSDAMQEMRNRFRAQGELRDEEIAFRRKDGQIRHGRLSGVIISQDNRRYSLITVRDITESKKAEDALRASEERFRTLVESLRVGVSSWTPDGRCRFVNQALMEIFHDTEDRVLGRTPSELSRVYREDGTEIASADRPVEVAIRTRQPVRNQIMGWRRAGSEEMLWTLVDAIPEFGPNGEVTGAIASVTNISNLKKAEAEKRISQEMFSKAFHSSPDSMVITTLEDGRYLEVNEAFTRQYGWGREEAIGKTVSDLGIWPPGSDRNLFKYRLLNQGPISYMENRLCMKSGEVRDVLLSADLIQLNGQTCVLSITRDVTDKKRQEEALRASELRSRTLLEALRVGVGTWGPDGRCRSVNRALLDMTGMTEAHFIGKNSAEISAVFDEDGKEIPGAQRPAAKAKATGQPVRNQVLGLQHPVSKELVWVLADAVPEYAEDGQLTGLISSYTDITALKRAEEQKRKSEEMFSKAFHASPDSMTISFLSDGQVIEINDSFTRMFGWTREEVVGRSSFGLGVWTNPEDRERLKERLLSHGRTSQFEVTLRTKSGELRDFQLAADVITLNDQTCMLILAHDVTARKQREEALFTSEERFRTLVQNTDAGIVLFSADGQIQLANRAAERIFGQRDEEARGRFARELSLEFFDTRGVQIPQSERPVLRALTTGKPVHNKILGWRRPGTNTPLSWLVVNAVPQFSQDGRMSGVIASILDITEQKTAEETLRRLSARLLQLQDEERRRLGRDLHDSLAQLVLAVNLRLAQVTRSSPRLDEASRLLLAEARNTLQEMSRQIRTLSYLLHPPLLDELGLASAIREYAKGFGERSGISLNVDIQADFQRLGQEAETALFRIVQESLTNIQKHSGSPTASIRLHGDANEVKLEVRDRGRGMPPVTERTPDEPGTRFGVGILGMRERITQLGGELHIESNGRGTLVRARIPLPVEEPDAVSHSGGG